jgi:hypothetical protein
MFTSAAVRMLGHTLCGNPVRRRTVWADNHSRIGLAFRHVRFTPNNLLITLLM